MPGDRQGADSGTFKAFVRHKEVMLNKCVCECFLHRAGDSFKILKSCEKLMRIWNFPKLEQLFSWISSNLTEMRFDLKPHERVKLKIATEVWVFHFEPVSFWEQVCWSSHVLTDCRAAVAVWSAVYLLELKCLQEREKLLVPLSGSSSFVTANSNIKGIVIR